jgi:hypothetical protein
MSGDVLTRCWTDPRQTAVIVLEELGLVAEQP